MIGLTSVYAEHRIAVILRSSGRVFGFEAEWRELVNTRKSATRNGRMGKMVSLSPSEISLAAMVGVRRHVSAIAKRLQDRHGYDGDGWGVHIEGALGEMALAKFLGVYWDGSVDVFKRPDLPGVQVRTRSRHDYELIVRLDDRNDEAFVLVTGKAPRYRVVGWILGGDAKRPEWRQSHGGRPAAWFVPHSALHSIESLVSKCQNVQEAF